MCSFQYISGISGYFNAINEISIKLEKQTKVEYLMKSAGIDAVTKDAIGFRWTCEVHQNLATFSDKLWIVLQLSQVWVSIFSSSHSKHFKNCWYPFTVPNTLHSADGTPKKDFTEDFPHIINGIPPQYWRSPPKNWWCPPTVLNTLQCNDGIPAKIRIFPP